MGKNVVILVHIDNKKKDTLVLDKGPIKEEAEYSINFSRTRKFFCLSLYYNGGNSFLFVNATKIYQFKVKNSQIKPYPLCLGNFLKDIAFNNMKKQD